MYIDTMVSSVISVVASFRSSLVKSTTARFDRSHVSCGVLEVHHLPSDGAQKTVFAIANHLYHKANPRPGSFVLFSDVVSGREHRGEDLAKAIQAINCGSIWASSKQVNPRTGNTIQLWCFEVNHEKFRKWYLDGLPGCCAFNVAHQDELANRIEE